MPSSKHRRCFKCSTIFLSLLLLSIFLSLRKHTSLFFNKEMELSLVGLQNAGKTSLVGVLATGAFQEVRCHVFSSLESVFRRAKRKKPSKPFFDPLFRPPPKKLKNSKNRT